MILYLSEFIYSFIYLFNLLIYVTYLSDIYQKYIYQIIKNLSGYISENDLHIMIYKYNSFEFRLYSLQKGTK